jgi:hypothetical protein
VSALPDWTAKFENGKSEGIPEPVLRGSGQRSVKF